MPRARKESGLYYVTRDGREINLGTGSAGLLGGLERDLLFAHLNYAFRVTSQALRATVGTATVASGSATVEQPLPLDISGDPDAIPANRIKD